MHRKTLQRSMILESLRRSGRPLSTPELLKETRKRVPNLGVATVYRTIREFTKAGKIVLVQPSGASDRYELGGLEPHNFFLCKKCDRVYNIPVHVSADDIEQVPEGYRVEDHDLTLKGYCPQCT